MTKEKIGGFDETGQPHEGIYPNPSDSKLTGISRLIEEQIDRFVRETPGFQPLTEKQKKALDEAQTKKG
ncbi:MAG: hypothetical protein V1858_05430 [Candidatus Gottesmanbacteria bacterium]